VFHVTEFVYGVWILRPPRSTRAYIGGGTSNPYLSDTHNGAVIGAVIDSGLALSCTLIVS
jgi:hypothetical protein